MDQLHKRFNTEQVKMLFERYNTGDMSRTEIQEILGLGNTRFFALLKSFKNDTNGFEINHQRIPRSRLSIETETKIARFGLIKLKS